MESCEKLPINTCSVQFETTLMVLGPAGVSDASAAVMLRKAPGVAPVQSTVTVLANIRPGVITNRKPRTTLNLRARNFMFYSSPVFSKLSIVESKIIRPTTSHSPRHIGIHLPRLGDIGVSSGLVTSFSLDQTAVVVRVGIVRVQLHRLLAVPEGAIVIT